MPKRGDATAGVLGLAMVLLVGLSSCESPSTTARCDTMAAYLDGRARQFDRSCEVDTDCQIVFVRPGEPLAVNGVQPADDALARTLSEYEAQCAPLPRGSGSPFAVCEQRILESADPNDPTRAVFEVLDQVCVVRGTWTVNAPPEGEVDAGTDVGSGDPEPCDCTSDAACATGRCVSCACVPAGPCGDACVQADACDATDALQLATRLDVCAASCEIALEAQGAFTRFVDCLNTSSCEQIVTCRGLLP
jgi:hypothetical protein